MSRQRMECAQLAAALDLLSDLHVLHRPDRARALDSGSKLRALHTLREVRKPEPFHRKQRGTQNYAMSRIESPTRILPERTTCASMPWQLFAMRWRKPGQIASIFAHGVRGA